ncbi:MAG: response regulator [Elusimicrobia bacterium]|nr:response regulator [Elusimicrobiota bacterium]
MDKKKVMIVDDELEICRLFEVILSNEGYEVDTAISGDEALEKLDYVKFPVIMMDIMMPGITGLELLKKVKTLYSDIQVIMVTTSSSIKDVERALKLGAFAYLTKPIKRDDIITAVKQAYENFNKLISRPAKDEGDKIIYVLLIVGYDGRICKINNATAGLLGYTQGELANCPIADIVDIGDRWEKIKEINTRKREENYELNMINKNREKILYSFDGAVINDQEKKTIGFVGMISKK